MSVLSELFKTIGETLHMPVLTKPLWEEVIREVDVMEARLSALERSVSTSPLSMDPAMVAEMKDGWVRETARRVEADRLEAVAAEAVAAEAAAASAAAAETNPADTETKPAEGETAGADPQETDQGAAAAATDSGTAGDIAGTSPTAQPDLAAVGGQA